MNAAIFSVTLGTQISLKSLYHDFEGNETSLLNRPYASKLKRFTERKVVQSLTAKARVALKIFAEQLK